MAGLLVAVCGAAATLGAAQGVAPLGDGKPAPKGTDRASDQAPAGSLSAALRGLNDGLGEALRKSIEENFSQNEQLFLGQVIAPALGTDPHGEIGRWGAWLLGQDPTTARGDLAPISLTETHLDNYRVDRHWPLGQLRNLRGEAFKDELNMVFARVHSPDQPPRVMLLSVVEQRSDHDKEAVRLYQVQMEYEIVNRVYKKKQHRVIEIK